jgi:hypothetical protein
MEELGYKHLISWIWGCKRDVIPLFAKNIMSFEGLELHDELLEGVIPIIQNCQERR